MIGLAPFLLFNWQTGGTVASTVGKLGNAADFTAAQTRYLGATGYATLTVVSIEGWIRCDSGGNGGIMTFEGAAAGLRVRRDGDNFKISFGASGNDALALAGLTADTPHHIYFAYDTATHTGYGAIDGGTISSTTDAGYDPNLTTPHLYLGLTDGAAWGDLWIDALNIRNRLLNQANVNAAYNSGNGIDITL